MCIRDSHNTQVVEKPELSSGGVAFFSGKEKSAADYEQELFYHIVAVSYTHLDVYKRQV